MYEAVVIGGSSGALAVMMDLFAPLSDDYPLPIIVVAHLHPADRGDMVRFMDCHIPIRVQEAREKHPIHQGRIYVAPANYHLLVEHDKTFSLTVDKRVNFARPSIDVLFESAAFVFRERLVGILLTGANTDGAKGIAAIKQAGGLTIAQDPSTAKHGIMPRAALDTGCVDRLLTGETLFDILR